MNDLQKLLFPRANVRGETVSIASELEHALEHQALPLAVRRLAGEAAAGVPVVLAPTIGAFVPQHVNLDLAGGVVFNKGCYPGQEVVSRMHHLGETPRRGLILASEEALQLEPGAPIFSGEEEAGAALALARTGRGTLLFASVKRSLAAGTLRAGSPKGAELSAVKLPYGGI